MSQAKLNRRSFGTLVSSVLAGTAAAAAQDPRRSPAPQEPPFGPMIEFKRADVELKVQPFSMTQVRLRAGAFADAAEWNRGYMARLAEDRLVHNFRLNAGLPTSASPLGGWEEPMGELRGHFTGHYLSASALLSASTGDKDVKSKADAMVADLAACQTKLGGGYLSAFPREFWDRLDRREKVWAPFYTVHKIMAGMLDMYQYGGNNQALIVAEGMAGWADEWTASKSEAHMQDILRTEFGGMAETLYNLSVITNNDKWVEVGDRFTKKEFFNPLALRGDQLTGLHVNTHIPQVIGAARRYEISGDTRFHDVSDFFWTEVTGARSYVTGGTSVNESWRTPPRMLAAEWKQSANTEECCCAYNMLKLTRHLYGWRADPRYFDYYERALYNHRLGTIQPQAGHTQYFLSLTPGAWKTFNTEDQSFWCCTGTGVEEYAKLNDSIYWHDDDGVYVNLFIPSDLNWTQRGFQLRQETKFPAQDSTTLTVMAANAGKLALHLRIPQWTASDVVVKINGRALEATASAGSYLSINRVWKAGDRVEMSLPMKLHLEAMPDDPTTQAVMYGPLVLAGDLGADGITPELVTGPQAPQMNRNKAALEIPAFTDIGGEAESWIKPTDTPLTFRTHGQKQEVRFVPLNSIFGRRYSVYWKASGCSCG